MFARRPAIGPPPPSGYDAWRTRVFFRGYLARPLSKEAPTAPEGSAHGGVGKRVPGLEIPQSRKELVVDMEVATLGGGCFWCLEAVFLDLVGVESVQSGYSGGAVANPTYEEVCLGTTGHAEVVQVRFDPSVISFREILEVFFAIHDPTTLNRQGADVGTQYRSVIFFHSPSQKKEAEGFIQELGADGPWADPIVTRVEPFTEFFSAESYHDDYYRRNQGQPYCRAVISPKLAKFRAGFAHKLRSSRSDEA